MDVALRGIKNFAATVCVGEPPDAEYVIDTIWEGAQRVLRTDRGGPVWRTDLRKAADSTDRGGVYFIASYSYQAANMPIVLRMAAKAWPTPYDVSGEYCSNAYPLHINLRFEDTWGWDHVDSEQVVGVTMRTLQLHLSTQFGLPSQRLFWLVQGGWRHGARYEAAQRIA
jgi:hypothetical protein